MVLTTQRLTFDDLRQMPEDGQRHEVIEGAVYVSPAPAPKHQEILVRLCALLFAFVTVGRLGKVYSSPIDVKLFDNGGVQPDIVFVRRERLAIVGPHYIDGAPDLLVEIFSPSTRGYDEETKFRLYAAAGVPELWFVDPEAETLTIFALRDGAYVPLGIQGGFASSVLLPGLEIDIPALFADLT